MDERIRQRTDVVLRTWLDEYDGALDYLPLDSLMISEQAWEHISNSSTEPRMVFAHPVLLRENPALSAYYRGIALLSQKRVSDLATAVANWEDPDKQSRVNEERSIAVSCLYNAVISSIIEGTTDWSVERLSQLSHDGFRPDGTCAIC